MKITLPIWFIFGMILVFTGVVTPNQYVCMLIGLTAIHSHLMARRVAAIEAELEKEVLSDCGESPSPSLRPYDLGDPVDLDTLLSQGRIRKEDYDVLKYRASIMTGRDPEKA